jgi:hypothetical protein
VFWTPIDLVSSLASSEAALQGERERVTSCLESLRSSLADTLSGEGASGPGARQFSNSASDFFCLARVLSARSVYSNLEDLAALLEAALSAVQRGGPNTEVLVRAQSAIEAELERLR